MPEQDPTSREDEPAETPGFDPKAFDSFGKQDGLATLSWYLVTSGIVLLIFAALCLFLSRTGSTDFFKHKDFVLNPTALSRYLLLAGLVCYAAGRSITYYRRFRKREPG
jgi:hypothetical protein